MTTRSMNEGATRTTLPAIAWEEGWLIPIRADDGDWYVLGDDLGSGFYATSDHAREFAAELADDVDQEDHYAAAYLALADLMDEMSATPAPPPRNRIEYNLSGHTGSITDLRGTFDNISYDLAVMSSKNREECQVVSGAGYSLRITCNREQTDEQYQAQLQEWWQAQRDSRPAPVVSEGGE